MRISTPPSFKAPINIAVLAMDGAIYSSIIGPLDVFSVANVLRAASGQPAFAQVRVLGAGDSSPLSFNQLNIHIHGQIHDADRFDVVLLPAMMGEDQGQGGAFPAFSSPRVVSWLRRQHQRGACLTSVCAGAFLLAKTGLLDGRAATTHWNLADQFAASFPRVRLKVRKMLIDEQDLITAGGVTAYFDLALYLVRKFGSDELAAGCSKFLLIDPRRGSQSPYQPGQFQKSHADADILSLQEYMEHHYAEPLTLAQLAKFVGLGQRTLLRRFRAATGDSPIMYLQRMRIEAARRKLELSDGSIEQIAWQVGYEDTSSFSRLFKKMTAMTPGAYRKKFSLVVK